MGSSKYFKGDFFFYIQLLYYILCNNGYDAQKRFFSDIKNCRCRCMKNVCDTCFKYHNNMCRIQSHPRKFAKYFNKAIKMIFFARNHKIEVYPGRTISVLHRILKRDGTDNRFVRIYIVVSDTGNINKNRVTLAWWDGKDFNRYLH